MQQRFLLPEGRIFTLSRPVVTFLTLCVLVHNICFAQSSKADSDATTDEVLRRKYRGQSGKCCAAQGTRDDARTH